MIECMRFKPVNKGCLVGFADLFLPKMNLELFGCAFYVKNNKEKWVSLPCKEFQDDTGSKKYIPMVKFRNASFIKLFSEEAVACIEKKINEIQEDAYTPPKEGPKTTYCIEETEDLNFPF